MPQKKERRGLEGGAKGRGGGRGRGRGRCITVHMLPLLYGARFLPSFPFSLGAHGPGARQCWESREGLALAELACRRTRGRNKCGRSD